MDPNFHQQQQQQNHDDGGVVATGSKSGSYLCRQSSARWIPTGDQIRILRDLYYNYGVRSPSAEQIQRISAKLRQYGKIEGKNVFYWFQNHKARERQKKRLTADISTSTANKFGSVSMCSYDAGQFGNASSVSGEKSFKGCCFSGEMTESSTVGWFGLEAPFQVPPWPYHYGIGGQEIVTPAATARAIETLPLFPIHIQANVELEVLPDSFYCGDGAVGVQSQEENMNGYHQNRRGGNGASLELTLNSHYEPRSSM